MDKGDASNRDHFHEINESGTETLWKNNHKHLLSPSGGYTSTQIYRKARQNDNQQNPNP